MPSNLPRVAHEHHERLIRHVDELPALGDMIGKAPVEELRPRLDETGVFLTGLLIPHMEAAERGLYPELERMLQNRHSMTPMRHEHEEIRRLVAEFERLRHEVETGGPNVGRSVALRRVVFRLYALLKVHLAEEELYVRTVNHGVTEEAAEAMAAALSHAGIAAP
ncbi:MAG: hemerythrin domain-containing protein [Chloroflexota bacterium]